MGAAKRFRQHVKSLRKEQRQALYGVLVGPGPVVFKKLDSSTQSQ